MSSRINDRERNELASGIVFSLVRIARVAPLNRREGIRQADPQNANATSIAAPSKDGEGITLAKFERLKTGMSYSEAVGMLGSAGVESSRAELGGVTTVMYIWKALAGIGNINAMFQNGRLITKTQFGLE